MSTDHMQTGAEAHLIGDVLNQRLAAIRAKDVPGFLALYATDVVMFDLAPPLQYTGADEQGTTEWYSTWQGPIGYQIRDLRIAAAGDVAFSHSLVHLTGARTNGENTDLWFRETICYRKVNGDWKIAHEHGSVPLRMDEKDKAATGLQP